MCVNDDECVSDLWGYVDDVFLFFPLTDSFIFQDTKGGESEHINLKVLGQDNAVVQFKIKRHTPLRKLMNAYCDRAVSFLPLPSEIEDSNKFFFFNHKGLSMQVVRFRFDGSPINENDTPTSLEMEEGDTIEVYQQQTGGGCNSVH